MDSYCIFPGYRRSPAHRRCVWCIATGPGRFLRTGRRIALEPISPCRYSAALWDYCALGRFNGRMSLLSDSRAMQSLGIIRLVIVVR